jgi:hypothetical protein
MVRPDEPQTPPLPRGFSQVIGSLFANLKRLLRDEVELAKAEVGRKVSEAGKSVIWLVAGGVAAFIGVLAVVAALILGLALFMPAWAAALIVGAIILCVAAIVISTHLKKLRNADLVPHKTIHTLQENVEFLKEQVS